MFCPKCGQTLTEIDGDLTCQHGNMPLSPEVSRSLAECFITRTRTPSDLVFPFQIGETWFCPGCGLEAREHDGRIICPACSASLNEFIPALVEQHPHMSGQS